MLPDSGSTLNIINTSSARKLGLKTISKPRGSYELVKTATNESVMIDGQAEAKIMGKDRKTTEVTIYVSLGIVQDLLILSRTQ